MTVCDSQTLRSLLDELGWLDTSQRYLLIAGTDRPRNLPADITVEWLSIDSANIPIWTSGAVVVDVCAPNVVPKAMRRHLLARVRDTGGGRVAVLDDAKLFGPTDFLSLGYTRRQLDATSGRFFVHDADAFFERREWNSPADWAHPENFDRSRW